MHAYLTAHASKQHERHFGWKTFRVLTVTTDDQRVHSMQEKLRELEIPNTIGASLFLFAIASQLATSDPLSLTWRDGNNRDVRIYNRALSAAEVKQLYNAGR